MDRRQFLYGSLASAGALASPYSMSMNLGLGQRLITQSNAPLEGYKALVCIFLYGGHDSLNLLVPTATEDYATYTQTRQNLAYPFEDIVPLNTNNQTNYAVGMPTAAQDLVDLFNDNKLAFVANVGPMRQAASKIQLLENESLRPPQLFSHNDQQLLWQAGADSTQARTGWAGRMADLVMDTNNPLSMNMTTHGTNLWQAGNSARPFAINTEGPEAFAGLNPDKEWNQRRYNASSRIRQLAQGPFEQEYSRRINSAELNNKAIISALAALTPSDVEYPSSNPLSDQLKMTADLIQSQSTLGHNRQIFFVGLGGFDTHDNQVEQLPALVRKIGAAMKAFQEDLALRGISQDVLTFTQSDFGRTLTSNGDGTDHGWGGHQLIMGDAVKPRTIAGNLPSLALNSDDDLEDGRIIPTTSIEQYAQPLASWFGLNEQDITSVFPNMNRFDSTALDVLQS